MVVWWAACCHSLLHAAESLPGGLRLPNRCCLLYGGLQRQMFGAHVEATLVRVLWPCLLLGRVGNNFCIGLSRGLGCEEWGGGLGVVLLEHRKFRHFFACRWVRGSLCITMFAIVSSEVSCSGDALRFIRLYLNSLWHSDAIDLDQHRLR